MLQIYAINVLLHCANTSMRSIRHRESHLLLDNTVVSQALPMTPMCATNKAGHGISTTLSTENEQ